MNQNQITNLADRLIAAYDHVQSLDPITASFPQFDVADAYTVLREINARREANGWKRVGRKIGFTNRTIWARYGVDRPMWAPMYANTVHRTLNGRAEVSLDKFAQPRIEPEVVFGLRGPVPSTGSARDVLGSVEWVAAGFEIVQSHYPGWKFTAADCTAAFGLHACLVVGPIMPLDNPSRDRLASVLPAFEVALHRDDEMVERGRGSNVLGSPALALQYLAQVLASQPQAPPLAAGEIVTTGTLTDAQPIVPGTRWRSDYGQLGVLGLELRLK
jgi:2-oxo-3-hexenedioate decarboxylase